MGFGFGQKKSTNFLQRVKNFFSKEQDNKEKKEEQEQESFEDSTKGKDATHEQNKTGISDKVSPEAIEAEKITPEMLKKKIRMMKRIRALKASQRLKKLKRKLKRKEKKALARLKKLARLHRLQQQKLLQEKFKTMLLSRIRLRTIKRVKRAQKKNKEEKRQEKNKGESLKEDGVFKEAKRGRDLSVLRKMEESLSVLEKPESMRTDVDRAKLADLGAVIIESNKIINNATNKGNSRNSMMMSEITNREAVDFERALPGQYVGQTSDIAAQAANAILGAAAKVVEAAAEAVIGAKDKVKPEKQEKLERLDKPSIPKEMRESAAEITAALRGQIVPGGGDNNREALAISNKFRNDKYGEMSQAATDAIRKNKSE